MIEVKAESVTKDGEKGVQLTCSFEGVGEEVVNEALVSIRAIIAGVKKQSFGLYAMMIAAMAEDQSILRGERDGGGEDDNKGVSPEARLATLLTRSIVGRRN